MQRDDEEEISIIAFVLAVIHILLVAMRALRVIDWNWLIILIPEMLFTAGVIVEAVILLFKKVLNSIRRRMHYGK